MSGLCLWCDRPVQTCNCDIVVGGFSVRRMTSKQTYPCFTCRKAGIEVQVFLDGKDEQGNTKRLNLDGTRHYHQQPSSTAQEVVHQGQTQPAATSTTIVTQSTKDDRILALLNDLNIKLNHVIKLLEGSK
jgi:hypothetical protein